jgi:BirA family biotin operon repressor/biotin-[acetyl-CoA-carboxylase] ligase
MLRQSGDEFISGELISERLGITRAAVWKHMQALQREGVDIEAVTRKGYRLRSSANALLPSLIEPELKTRSLGREMIYLNNAPSTNIVARQLSQQGCAHGTVVLAEEQTAGRGRRGRAWLNSPGKDICMSAVLRPRLEAQHAPRFTLSTALGIYRVAAALGLVPSIKWPNDVLVAGKKLCGILLEMEGNMDSLESIIVGLGLNVNTDEFPQELASIAPSLGKELNRTLSRREVLSSLLNELEPLYDACEDDAAFADVLNTYKKACGTLGQAVDVTGVRETLSGIAEDVDEAGRLLLRTPDGVLHTISAGDVSLRTQS